MVEESVTTLGPAANLAFLGGLPTPRQVSVLTGDGEHFCGGLDLAALRGQPEKVLDVLSSRFTWSGCKR